ncbi:hypothetical protein DAPPUDRAFT_268203 [Daphnia pulex]|uniref:Uncharacterized protein n=1 Tax=Daphnia pulex TaxID=6669 RepID=E9HXE5_DAPPU|nr:hypothetical protein DAPPUDRAFT_268203 [Daphnia pulex]|eukprot:EFX63585.1 hypothetical protein DAPPUDRAFT_268203 [Daphnia pulex]
MPLWRNWLARSAVNRKAGGSIPPRGACVGCTLMMFFLCPELLFQVQNNDKRTEKNEFLSKMKVKYTVQMLSNSVANGFWYFRSTESTEEMVLKWNNLLYVMNGRSKVLETFLEDIPGKRSLHVIQQAFFLFVRKLPWKH